MTRIRPTVRDFGPVAPGGAAAIGSGLQDIGQAVGQFAELQTNRELLDIRERDQIDRLEQIQFEKVERSEAIAQFTAKQIKRNEAAAQILSEARESRSFENVQKDMDEFEDAFNQDLFEGRSQEFKDIFEVIDRSARVGFINKLGTAVEAGRLGIIRDNFQSSIQGIIDGVGAFTTPADIVESFDDLREAGNNMGFTLEALDITIGQGRRTAMEKLIRSLPLIDGLAALSDENVAQALGEDGRETLRRDLNTKARLLNSAQELVNAAFLRTHDIDVLDSFRQGESVTVLSSRIRNADGLSPTEKRDRFDFLEILSIAREKGPQPVDPEILQVNKELSNGLMNRVITKAELVRDSEKGAEEEKTALLELSDKAITIYREAVLKEARGEFDSSELTKLRFRLYKVTEGLDLIEEVAKTGFLEKLEFAGAFLLSPFSALEIRRKHKDDTTSADFDLRVPNAILIEKVNEMFLGEGRYGDLSSKDKASFEAFLFNEALQTENAGKPLPRKEANALIQNMLVAAQKQFLEEEKGVSPEAIEQVEELFFKTGTPVTEARQQVDIARLADEIRLGLSQGLSEEALRQLAQSATGFNDEAFDRALAIASSAMDEPIFEPLDVNSALSGELGVVEGFHGQVATEVSITVTDSRLNKGRPTNIPTLVLGQINIRRLADGEGPFQESIEIAIKRAVERQKQGANLPSFDTISEAEAEARLRSRREGLRIR